MVEPSVNRTLVGNVKFGALTATAVVLLSMMPQLLFWFVRGADWQGAYAVLQGDEFLYSAYINALIDGRPRRNDPFAGRDSIPTSPLPESTFSIQFTPSFAIAWLARAFHLSASSAFIALLAIAGLLASISLYWLLASITSDRGLAALAVMFVLCFGALAGGQGIIGFLLKPGVVFLGLPFLRRYQPAADLPLFFVFCALIWRALNPENKRRAWLYSTLAGFTLAVLIFSYLYLWTAAAAWLACLALLWLYLRPKGERLRALALLLIPAIIATFTLIPFAYLVSQRASSLDQAQTLVATHRPDPVRAPEIIGIVLLVLLAAAVRRGKAKRSDARVVFAASFALLPLILFNQQILTGRSTQPYHFESFVVNYAVLIGFVIVTMFFYQPIKRRLLLWIAVLCFLWGAIEVTMPVLANYRSNVAADQMVPVLVMGLLPTWAPQGTLLGMGGLDFGSASQQERKELLFIFLYYSAADAGRLRELLNETSGDTFMNHYARIAIFGHERVVPMLSFHFEPIRPEEVEEEVKAYESYADSFSREKVLLHQLTYVVSKGESDLSHVDLWYERDAGERFGEYRLYRVKLRE